MENYHLRRKEKVMEKDEIIQVLKRNMILTIALSMDNIPYLVTMDYAFDEQEMCFYFHCARTGKKIDYILANSAVWGQILEDDGYILSECSHAYKSVHFKGQVEFLEEISQKKEILSFMIDQFEQNPEPVKTRFITDSSMENVRVGKIQITEIMGKKESTDKPKILKKTNFT